VGSLAPEAVAAVIGQLILLLTRLLVHASVTPDTTETAQPVALDRLLSVIEVSRILNLRPARVYDLVRRRTLPAVRAGKFIRIRPHDLRIWIEKNNGHQL